MRKTPTYEPVLDPRSRGSQTKRTKDYKQDSDDDHIDTHLAKEDEATVTIVNTTGFVRWTIQRTIQTRRLLSCFLCVTMWHTLLGMEGASVLG